ncbi:MAG: chloramphenicol acetyltransferase [Methanobrevibacter sp.]|jgi:chloramphenicol O-acetyltransferase type A|nr:chloramphenicol acetyltransferase [Candidatus Methanoflexus mossambicus]
MVMKEIDFDFKSSPFLNFFTSRVSVSARVNIENALKFTKENNLSFFIVSLGCLLYGLNSVDELRRRIINDKTIEFSEIDGITPIMAEDNDIWGEIRVLPPNKFKSIFKWHEYVVKTRDSFLNNEISSCEIPMSDRDTEPIANFSCVPWIDFDAINSCIAEPHQIQPLVTWGKFSKDFQMPVAITFSHIFVFGKQIADFYNEAQRAFDNPLIISL